MGHNEAMIGGCDRCDHDLDEPVLLVCESCFERAARPPEEPSEVPAAHQPLPARATWWMPGVDTTSEGRFDRYEREVLA